MPGAWIGDAFWFHWNHSWSAQSGRPIIQCTLTVVDQRSVWSYVHSCYLVYVNKWFYTLRPSDPQASGVPPVHDEDHGVTIFEGIQKEEVVANPSARQPVARPSPPVHANPSRDIRLQNNCPRGTEDGPVVDLWKDFKGGGQRFEPARCITASTQTPVRDPWEDTTRALQTDVSFGGWQMLLESMGATEMVVATSPWAMDHGGVAHGKPITDCIDTGIQTSPVLILGGCAFGSQEFMTIEREVQTCGHVGVVIADRAAQTVGFSMHAEDLLGSPFLHDVGSQTGLRYNSFDLLKNSCEDGVKAPELDNAMHAKKAYIPRSERMHDPLYKGDKEESASIGLDDFLEGVFARPWLCRCGWGECH